VLASGAATVTDFDDYVAQEKGFYADHDVKTTYVQTQIASQAIQLLATGDADIGRGFADAVQANVRTDGELDFISVGDALVRPPHVLVTTGAKTLPDVLRNKVAISSPSDQTTVVTEALLEGKGFDSSTADLIPAGGTASRLAAMDAGGVDATLMLPPLNFKAQAAGRTSMGSMSDLLGPDWMYSFTSVVVERRWAERNRDLLIRFLQARDDALRWLADPANREEAIDIFIEYTDAKPKAAAATYDLIMRRGRESFRSRVGVDREADATVLRTLYETGHSAEPALDVGDYVDPRYADEARRRNDAP